MNLIFIKCHSKSKHSFLLYAYWNIQLCVCVCVWKHIVYVCMRWMKTIGYAIETEITMWEGEMIKDVGVVLIRINQNESSFLFIQELVKRNFFEFFQNHSILIACHFKNVYSYILNLESWFVQWKKLNLIQHCINNIKSSFMQSTRKKIDVIQIDIQTHDSLKMLISNVIYIQNDLNLSHKKWNNFIKYNDAWSIYIRILCHFMSHHLRERPSTRYDCTLSFRKFMSLLIYASLQLVSRQVQPANQSTLNEGVLYLALCKFFTHNIYGRVFVSIFIMKLNLFESRQVTLF